MRRAIAFLFILLSPVCARPQSASFIKSDTTTSGNWMGVYGADGNFIQAAPQMPPSYVSGFTPSGNSTYTWESGGNNKQDLQTGSSRIAACWYSATSFQFNLSMTGTHQVALYLLDWDSYNGGRNETITIAGIPHQYSGFTKGVYAVFSITGPVTIQIVNNNPNSNAVVSGIFFDTPGGTVSPPITATHSVILNWNGTGPFNVYRNGVKITASPITSNTYTDTTVQAGQTYSFTITAIVNGVESTQAPVTAFTIPSP